MKQNAMLISPKFRAFNETLIEAKTLEEKAAIAISLVETEKQGEYAERFAKKVKKIKENSGKVNVNEEKIKETILALLESH
jgi:Cu/Ag efflux protein CusF